MGDRLVGDAENLTNADRVGGKSVSGHQLLNSDAVASGDAVKSVTGDNSVGVTIASTSRRLGSGGTLAASTKAAVGEGVQATTILDTVLAAIDDTGRANDVLSIRRTVQVVPLPEETTSLQKGKCGLVAPRRYYATKNAP